MKFEISKPVFALFMGVMFGIAVGSLLGGTVVASQNGQDGFSRLFGVWQAGVVEETHDMSVGYDVSGKERSRKTLEERRELLAVPSHYGYLVGVTGGVEQSVLWYQDNAGVIRNVLIEGAGLSPLRIDPKETFKRKAKMIQR